jgi:hypothetical protein
MRILSLCFVFIVVFLSCTPAPAWHNGGPSHQLNGLGYGGHDWIAGRAYKLVAARSELKFIGKNMKFFLLGTEAPDTKHDPIDGEDGYADTIQCHCINYDKQGHVVKDRAAMRAQAEFDKARGALAEGNYRLAAYYAGAMAHYIGDLSQFCHLMSPDGPFGDDEGTLHSRYEEVLDVSINPKTASSSILNPYLKAFKVPGVNAYQVALSVADHTAHGGGTARNPKWMWARLTKYKKMKIDTKPDKWEKGFRDQTGANVNYAINGIAKMLRALGQ